MTTMTAIKCRIAWCATGDEEPRPGPLCHTCEARIVRVLSDLVDAYDWLADRMVPSSTNHHGGMPGGGRRVDPPAPLRVDLADARAAITRTLADTATAAWSWLDGLSRSASLAAGRRHTPLPAPGTRDAAALARWVAVRLPALDWWDGLPDAATALSEALSRAYEAAPWGRARRDLPAPCPKCGMLGLCLYGGDDWIRCRGCSDYRVPWWKYEGWVRRVLAERGQRAGAA